MFLMRSFVCGMVGGGEETISTVYINLSAIFREDLLEEMRSGSPLLEEHNTATHCYAQKPAVHM